MTTQPARHLVELAIEVAGWSPCRSKRGAIIFRGADVVAHGHNYKPRGFECDGSESCKATCRAEAVHAEQQAIVNGAGRPKTDGADMLHVKAVDGRLVPSGGPSCVQCSKLIVAAGIAGMWLYHADGWRRYDAAEFHRLSAAAASSAADLTALRWQPIETAPKDGTDILVLHPDRSVCISYWGCIRGVYGVKSKLHSSASGGEGDFCRDATHWMPLPEAPK